MSKPSGTERTLCEEYCSLYPKLKDYTLARKIFVEVGKKYPKLNSIEKSRTYVRKIRGHSGNRQRAENGNKKFTTPVTYDTTNYKTFKEELSYAKVLVLDIETAPLRVYVWDIWNQNVATNQIDSDWFCLTWSAKWLFDKKVYSGAVTSEESISQNDKRIMKQLWGLLNEADIVIAHNGDKFDIPRINTRFLIHKLSPPLPYQSIDTLRHIRRQFGFSSNKLDYVNKLLNLERKQDTGGFELWEKCYKGDPKAIKKMLLYNIKDVKILEETYLRIRPWIKPHPNAGLYILDHLSRCPACSSSELINEGKSYYTTMNRYDAFRCNNCGSVGRVRKSSIEIKERRYLTVSIPK